MEQGLQTEEVAESPVIELPKDEAVVEMLKAKSEEYRKRYSEGNEYTHPEQLLLEAAISGSIGIVDAMLKERLLNRVLEEGQVSTWDFTKDIIEDPIFQDTINQDASGFVNTLSNACAVVDAYCSGEAEVIDTTSPN